MKTAFLIINYNDSETTRKLLKNIKDYNVIDYILIVDNHSTDNSFEILKEYEIQDKIEVIQNTRNGGYAYAMNIGCRYLIDKFDRLNIIISNSDIVIYKEQDIYDLISLKRDDCAVIAPVVKEHTGYNRGWKKPSPLQDILLNLPYIHRFLRSKLLFYPTSYYVGDCVEVEAVSGCFFMIDSICLNAIDYFDESTFLYYEENILAVKLKKIKKKLYIANHVEVFHNHSVSIDKSVHALRKFRILKDSQYYFHTTYQHANFIHRCLLKATVNVTYLLMVIVNKVKSKIKN